MAKRCVYITLSKTAENLEKYRSLPNCSQRAAAEQLNTSRGCLVRNILHKYKVAFRHDIVRRK